MKFKVVYKLESYGFIDLEAPSQQKAVSMVHALKDLDLFKNQKVQRVQVQGILKINQETKTSDSQRATQPHLRAVRTRAKAPKGSKPS